MSRKLDLTVGGWLVGLDRHPDRAPALALLQQRQRHARLQRARARRIAKFRLVKIKTARSIPDEARRFIVHI